MITIGIVLITVALVLYFYNPKPKHVILTDGLPMDLDEKWDYLYFKEKQRYDDIAEGFLK